MTAPGHTILVPKRFSGLSQAYQYRDNLQRLQHRRCRRLAPSGEGSLAHSFPLQRKAARESSSLRCEMVGIHNVAVLVR